MTIMVAYPYDPAGTRDECHIQDESHIILTNDNTYRVIVPEMAPFYTENLSIVHAESGLELKEGKDYNLGYRVLSAKKIAQRDLFGCIVLINPQLKGEFIVGYRTVGGNFVGIRSNVLTYLANALNDPVKTPFEKVIDRPAYFTPAKHEQHYADFVNKDGVAAELDGLAAAIDEAIENADSGAVGDLLARVNAVDALLNQYRQDTHIVDYGNPHKTTAVQAHALEKNAQAVDTFRAFNKTLVELADYINNRGITEADVRKYLAKFGDQVYDDRLTLKNNQAVIRSESGTTSIDLSTGDITISADELLAIMADSDVQTVGERMKFMAGANILEIVSSGRNGRTKDTLLYNGHEVIHQGTVRAKLREKGGVGMRVVTQDTDTIKWEGTSRPAAPLKARVVLPVATLSKHGTVKLTNSRTANNLTEAPTPYVINVMRKDLDGRVPKARVINGHEMSGNFSLDKDDIYLDKVDNTSDAAKPISTEQQRLLDRYSEGSHKHDLSGVNLEKATSTKLGVTRHAVSMSDSDINAAITPKLVGEYASKIVEVATASQGKMPADVLDVRYWRATADVTCSGLSITFPPDAELYMNRINYAERVDLPVPGGTLNFSTLFPNAYVNETFYIYINVEDDSIFYSASKNKLTNAVGRLHISTIKCGASAIANVTQESGTSDHIYDDNVSGILDIDSVTSVGMFRELEEHEDDPTAHIGDGAVGDAGTIGLDLIHNYDVVSQISDGSHNGIDEWEYFTGWDVTKADEVVVQPRLLDNNGLQISHGVMVSIPWQTGGTQYLAIRNRRMKFNDPSYVSEVLEDGVRKRKVAYVLNPERDAGTQSVDNWHSILGSYTDESGDVIDIVLWHSYRFYNEKQVWLRVYRNGVFERDLSHVNIGNWKLAPQHSRLYLIFEYWQGADGFHYGVEYQYDAMSITSRLDRVRVDLTFRDDSFDMDVHMSQLGDRITHWRATGKNTNQGYVNGNIKKAIDSGVLGFGGNMYSSSVVGSANSVLLYIDCIAADEGNQEGKYITAKGVYQSLRDGVNLLVAKGSAADGAQLPLLPNCRYVNVYLGWHAMGSTTSNDPIDGLEHRIRSSLTGDVITESRIDMLSLNRYMYVEAQYKTESEGGSAPITKAGSVNYLMAGLRDV